MLSAPDFCRSSLMKTDTVGPLAHTTRFSDVHSISRSPDVFRVMTDRTGTSNSSHQGSSHTRSASGPGLDKLHSWFASVINVSISDGANVRNRAVVAERFFQRSVIYGRLLLPNRTVAYPPSIAVHRRAWRPALPIVVGPLLAQKAAPARSDQTQTLNHRPPHPATRRSSRWQVERRIAKSGGQRTLCSEPPQFIVRLMDSSTHYVLNPEVHGGSEVLKLLAEGKYPLCPRCKAPLIVALTPEAAKAQQQNPGMRCPVSIGHFQSTAYFR